MSTSSLVVASDPSDGHPFLRQLAESFPGNDSGPGLDRLLRAAEHIRGNRRSFASWLAELAADEAAVADIAKRSYWHPNGFAKLVLHASVEPEFRIRLHVWPRSAVVSAGESNPHSHRWEFASHVLAGAGTHMVEFAEVAETGKPFRRYRYGTDPANPAALVADGEVRLKPTRVRHVGDGDVYQCDTSIVHTVRPVDAGLTATVVVQGPRRTPTTVVYCKPGESDDQPNLDLTEADFTGLVSEVLSSLDRTVSS